MITPPMFLALILTTAADPSGSPASFMDQARSACSISPPATNAVDGVAVTPFAALESDLAGYEVRDEPTGAWMMVFHDAASQSAAFAYAPCLGAQLRLLHQKTADTRVDGRWASVVFTTDAAYSPPRDGVNTRWTIPTSANGAVDGAAFTRLVAVIPHEQVHAFQKRAGAITPRWFHEGHAEWVGRQVTRAINPAQADRQRLEGQAALDALTGAPALDGWGGVSVKREAILRQLTPEDRRRAETDPAFVPPGPFTFGPEDLESDESNTPARYEASWRQFRDLAHALGDAPVRDWVRVVTDREGRTTSATLGETARAHLGRDLAERP